MSTGMGILHAKRSAEATTESAEATTESAKRCRNTEFQENEIDCVVAEGKASGDGHKNISREEDLELDTDDDDVFLDSPGSIRNIGNETTWEHKETIPIRSFTNCRKAYCALCDEDTGHFDDECPERCTQFLGDEQCFKKAHGDDDHYYLVFTGYCANCEASKLGYCRKHGF